MTTDRVRVAQLLAMGKMFMRLFVYEFVCGGGWSDRPLDGSLPAEGLAMHTAVLEDFARIPGGSVVTTCDARLNRPAVDPGGVRIIEVTDPVQERSLFRQLAAECEATFVIAPECHGILAERCRWVAEAGGTFLGSSQPAIELCADKLRLAAHLAKHGLPTVPTEPVAQRGNGEQIACPAVIKPRDGAGSQQTFLVRTQRERDRAVRSLGEGLESFDGICQPHIPGDSLSVAALISSHGSQFTFCPPAEQRLSDDGRFRYLGGRIPAPVVSPSDLNALVEHCVRTIPGLSGYVGFDLIQPTGPTNCDPLIVEINPRLTTSYLGYRALTPDNLAERILFPDRAWPELSWREEPVEWQIRNGELGMRCTRSAVPPLK